MVAAMVISSARRILAGVAIGVLAIAVIAVIAAAVPGPVTETEAEQHLVSQLTAVPGWETQEMVTALVGFENYEQSHNGNDGGGGCTYVNGRNASAGFACYIETSEATGSREFYFTENSSAGGLWPISRAQYSQLVGQGGA